VWNCWVKRKESVEAVEKFVSGISFFRWVVQSAALWELGTKKGGVDQSPTHLF